MKFIKELKRSHYCGELRAQHEGETVVMMGWVDKRRDHGGLVFVDLRDREGLIQIVLDPGKSEMGTSKDFRGEFVVAIQGVVRRRPEGMVNKKLATGEVEVEAMACEILSQAETPPFQINDSDVNESLRLKYRYLDLRTNRIQKNLRMRHEATQIARRFLSDRGFIEVETPILYKSTPEGARDYLVPSRVHPGEFYALPQSPQTLKQLLMIGSFDRYFQMARCFRDEDLRADRQPEFSQIDIEMSFIDVDDIISMNEKLLRNLWKEIRKVEIPEIPKMTYAEAMDRFGNDKPDIRFGMELKNLNDSVQGCGFKVFEDVVAKEGAVKGIAVPTGASFSRAKFDKLTDIAKKLGAKGLVWIKWESEKISSPISKFFSEDQLKALVTACGGGEGDAALIVADEYEVTCSSLSTLRLSLGKELNLIDKERDAFLWVVDFPLLEYAPEEKRWVARHHPFTMPSDEFVQDLVDGNESRFKEMTAKAYDLVCNGYELAGGSIRIHRQEIQRGMFKALGMSTEETRAKFGFFLDALQMGTPPHGGVAWGLDRLLMILCRTEAIRDVIAFPKTTKAQCLMSDAPGPVDNAQLIELGIRLRNLSKE